MSNPPPPPPPHDPQHAYVAPAGQVDEPKRSNWTGCLVGCLIAFGVCAVLCAGVGYWTYSNMSTWIATVARQGIEAALEEANLPAEEETAILEQFDRVVDSYQAGEASLEDVGEIMENITKSDITGLITLQAIETKYLNSSGLSDEEKEEAKRTVMRVVRGAVEEKINEEELKKLTEHFLIKSDESAEALPGDMQDIQPDDWKQSLTDDELRALLADAKELVNAKEIPDEDYEVQISSILRDAIDEVLVE